MQRLISLLAATFALATTAAADLDPTWGLVDHQVLQRNERDRGTAAFGGEAAGAGTLEWSLRRTGQVDRIRPWKSCGAVQPGPYRVTLTDLPVGGPYDLNLRLKSAAGKILERGTVRDLLVGDLWVLAGQSNMEGCGILKGRAVTPSRRVHTFDLAHRWLVAREPLHWKHEALDPVHSGPPSPKRAERARKERVHRWRGAGLGLPFARVMVERTGVPVGLLPCAKGATSLEQWSPAGRTRGGASLYGSMLHRITAAGGRVRGVLWYQGEADAIEGDAATYGARFVAFVAALRKDLKRPDLPFYWVQLGRYQFPIREPEWTAVRMAQYECVERIPGPSGCVTAIDQPLVDAIHVKTRGLITLGRRLALLALRDMGVEKGLRGGPRLAKVVSKGGYPQRIHLTFSGVNGRLVAGSRLAGFSIRDAAGKDLGIIFDQYIHPEHPNRVILECQVTWGFKPLPAGAYIHYGWGNDPYGNLTDSRGMAAAGFGPVPLPLPVRRR